MRRSIRRLLDAFFTVQAKRLYRIALTKRLAYSRALPDKL